MEIRSKSYGPEFEIIKLKHDKGLTITVERFQVPEGYKSFAYNSYIHHFDLLGMGIHEDKIESADLAIKDLYQLMEEFEGHKH